MRAVLLPALLAHSVSALSWSSLFGSVSNEFSMPKPLQTAVQTFGDKFALLQRNLDSPVMRRHLQSVPRMSCMADPASCTKPQQWAASFASAYCDGDSLNEAFVTAASHAIELDIPLQDVPTWHVHDNGMDDERQAIEVEEAPVIRRAGKCICHMMRHVPSALLDHAVGQWLFIAGHLQAPLGAAAHIEKVLFLPEATQVSHLIRDTLKVVLGPHSMCSSDCRGAINQLAGIVFGASCICLTPIPSL